MPPEEGQIRNGIGIYFEVGSVPLNGPIASSRPDFAWLLLQDPKGLRTDISQGREWLNFIWLPFPSA